MSRFIPCNIPTYLSYSKLAFLDRDGTLIVEKHYLSDPTLIELEREVVHGLHRLQDAGFGLIMVTNQSGIGRGFYTEDAFHAVQTALLHQLAMENLFFLGYSWCPHHPEATLERYRMTCTCRKPNPGMITDGLARFRIPAKHCIMIGDQDTDIQAGQAAGVSSIKVHPTGFPTFAQAVALLVPEA